MNYTYACNATFLKCVPACFALCIGVRCEGTFRRVCVFLGKACEQEFVVVPYYYYQDTSRLRLSTIANDTVLTVY